MAATSRLALAFDRLLGLLSGELAVGGAKAVDLPANQAEAMIHMYDGGGVQATGPALLVRKSFMDRFSLSAQYYVDSVSNASIDVVTTASPFKEKRTAYDFGLDYVVRDTVQRGKNAAHSGFRKVTMIQPRRNRSSEIRAMVFSKHIPKRNSGPLNSK